MFKATFQLKMEALWVFLAVYGANKDEHTPLQKMPNAAQLSLPPAGKECIALGKKNLLYHKEMQALLCRDLFVIYFIPKPISVKVATQNLLATILNRNLAPPPMNLVELQARTAEWITIIALLFRVIDEMFIIPTNIIKCEIKYNTGMSSLSDSLVTLLW